MYIWLQIFVLEYNHFLKHRMNFICELHGRDFPGQQEIYTLWHICHIHNCASHNRNDLLVIMYSPVSLQTSSWLANLATYMPCCYATCDVIQVISLYMASFVTFQSNFVEADSFTFITHQLPLFNIFPRNIICVPFLAFLFELFLSHYRILTNFIYCLPYPLTSGQSDYWRVHLGS